MLLLFSPQCTVKVKKSALQICKRLKAETIWWPFGFHFLCVGLYTVIQLHSCRHLLHWQPNLLITFTQRLFMPIKYLPWLFVHKSLFRYAFFICALLHFFLIHSALLCAIRGVCCVSPAALNCVQGRRCISINTSVCERRSYSSSILPAGHVWLIEL